jgi:hypothetical protein
MRRCFVCFLVCLTVLWAIPAVQAHGRVEVGDLLFVVGWRNEPVIVGERNAIELQVTQSGQPVSGVESVLEIAVDYGDKTFLGDLKPGSTPGVYWMEIMPTVRGTYTVRLAGTLADQTVNVSLSPEEVLAAKVLQFPATAPDSRDLGQQLDTLRTQLNTTNQLAMASLVLAALAIIGLCANLFITIKKKKVNHEKH